MCFGELVGWRLIRSHHFVYDKFTAQMFAFHIVKAATREKDHVDGS